MCGRAGTRRYRRQWFMTPNDREKEPGLECQWKWERERFERFQIDPGSQRTVRTGLTLEDCDFRGERWVKGTPCQETGITVLLPQKQTSWIGYSTRAHLEGASREGSVGISSENNQQEIRHCRGLMSLACNPSYSRGQGRGFPRPRSVCTMEGVWNQCGWLSQSQSPNKTRTKQQVKGVDQGQNTFLAHTRP